MLNKLIKFIIVTTVFLVPLFYLPFTQNPFQFNKEMLFLVLILAASALWFLQAIQERESPVEQTVIDNGTITE